MIANVIGGIGRFIKNIALLGIVAVLAYAIPAGAIAAAWMLGIGLLSLLS